MPITEWSDDIALVDLGQEPQLSDDLGALLASLDGLLASSDEQLHARYREHLSSLGREVRVELPNDRFVEGRALDVEDDGRLVVLDSCGVTHRLDVGDVVHLR